MPSRRELEELYGYEDRRSRATDHLDQPILITCDWCGESVLNEEDHTECPYCGYKGEER